MTSQSRHSRSPAHSGLGSPEPVGAHTRVLRVFDGPRAKGARRHNLPHLPSSFVGRDDDVAHVASLLAGSRLVTLTGPGGIGKTRLAIEAAMGMTGQFPGGAWLVELAPLTKTTALPEAISAVLPSSERPAERKPTTKDRRGDAGTVDQLVAQIGEQSILVVLDNCEHLVEACGHLVDLLLRSCPGLSILATSREPLGVGGEHRWTTGPLSLPDSAQPSIASVKASEAGQLFLQRATAGFPGFRLTKAAAPTVAEICRRLDGMPLAIELAAARLGSLSATDVLDRLDDRFALLTTGSRTVMARHQTLAATFEWSHKLLSPQESTVLRRTSVFAGWTLEAAQEVCAGGDIDSGEIIDHLGALADKSLVMVETGDDTMRYRLLESVRVWAAAKLDDASETDDVTRRHASWYLALAERAESVLGGGEAQPWLDRLDAESDNLRAALEWARTTGDTEIGVRLAAALTPFWRARAYLPEGLVWLEWALSVSDRSPVLLRAKILRSTGLFRGMLGDITSALPLLEESSALFAKAGNHDASMCACNSMFHMFRNPRQSLPELEAEVAACRHSGNTSRLGQFLSTLGQARFSLGDLSEARRLFEECVQLGRETADGNSIRSGLFGLGRVAGLLGEPDAAQAALEEALAQVEEIGDADDQAMALGLLGDLARAQGDWDRARSLLTESMRLTSAEGSPVSVARAVYFMARLEEAEQVDESDAAGALFERALSLGRAADAPGFHEARCLLGAGSTARGDDQHGVAAGRLLEALELAQAIGDTWATAQALDRLSALARLDRRVDEADTLARRGMELHHRMGDLAGTAASLESLAGLAVDGERWQMAARLLAASQAIFDGVGYARSRTDEVRQQHDLEQVRTALGEEFAEVWEEGMSLSADDAVTYAMRGRGTRGRPAKGWESLTPAERQVVSLVGEGLTNPEVGRRLFVSPRTVGHHLAHVYQKLGIHSRGALIKELAALDSE